MAKRKKKTPATRRKNSQSASPDWDLESHYQRNVEPLLPRCPWMLRVTEYKGKPVPVLIVKERWYPVDEETGKRKGAAAPVIKDRGLLHGQHQRICLPVIQSIMQRVTDRGGVPLELHRFVPGKRITFRGNLPLDDEAGAKIALLFKLQERVQDTDRVELIARRIEQFGQEEAAYWFSRITNFGEAANRWAAAGMKLMLGGQPGDKDIERTLEKLRSVSV